MTDIAQVEARHASNRELAHMQNRGWFPSLPTLAAKFVCTTLGHLRKMARAVAPMFDRRPETEQQQVVATDAKAAKAAKRAKSTKSITTDTTKQSSSGGGTWRAFVHEMSKGKKFNAETLASFGEQFRALTPEEKEPYVVAGKAATLAAQHGFASFGQTPRSKPVDHFSVHGKLVESVADIPAPGTALPSGAIVAANSDWDLHLATMYAGSSSFDDQYSRVKDLANAERKSSLKRSDLSKGQLLELQTYAGSASDDPFVQDILGQNMTETGAGFLRCGQRKNFVSFDWVAPISKAVQARND